MKHFSTQPLCAKRRTFWLNGLNSSIACMIRFGFYFAIFGLFNLFNDGSLTTTVFAQAKPLLVYNPSYSTNSETQNHFKKLITNIQTMQAYFVQRIYSTHGRLLQSANGTMAIQRPGLFFWKTEKPNSQVILIKENKMWIYDADLAQVTEQNFDNSLSSSPAALLSGAVAKIDQHFFVSQLDSQNKEQKIYQLQPKKKDNAFKKMTMVFRGAVLQQATFLDNLVQKTELNFYNVKLNKPVNPNIFQLHFPKDVDYTQSE